MTKSQKAMKRHAERIASLIRRNVDAMMTRRISFETFERRNGWLWRKAQGNEPLVVGDTRIRARLVEAVHRAL